LALEQLLYLLKHLPIHDGLVLSGIDFLLVADLAQVDHVREKVVQVGLGKG
jgi:hypothetical protein